ncbi:MAG: hypothetical protein IKK17_07580 [Oscillospiraceae bacterium]|nr:hypothetical protein [Oscillospiraceae bacterium]
MTLNYFSDILFDLLNDSDELDVYDIEKTEDGYRVTVSDGSLFNVNISRAEPKDNVLQLFPGRNTEE